ncbi:MAG TPA: transposase [Cycloclasticus sp.]|jgi:putative transposase|nr:transposase [Cycloclasticus sp.]
MALLPRYFVNNQPQHIIQRGNNREPTFVATEDYQFYITCLREAASEHQLKIHAYVLMTNHVHLLAMPENKTSIPKTMQSVGRRYVQYFNHTYKRTGTLWEGRYKATIIDSESYLLTCMRYIEMNPVRACMVKSPVAYPWSSYHVNATGKGNGLIIQNELYKRLGKTKKQRESSYRDLFLQSLTSSELKAFRDCTNKGWVLGNDKFKEKIVALSGRRTNKNQVGRPRKLGKEFESDPN